MLQGKLLTCAIFKDVELSSDAIYWIFYVDNTSPLCLSTILYISPVSSAYKSVFRFVEHFLTALSTQSVHNALINNKFSTFYAI
jgi:hypothetical protein